MRTRKRKHKYTITIGIVGTNMGVGVTHFAIMLCNYLASKEHCHTAFVDLSQRRSVDELQRIYDEAGQKIMRREDETLQPCFCMHGVDYYSLKDKHDIVNIIQLGYEYVVLDMGVFFNGDWIEEIRRCHIRFLVGNCCEWRQKDVRTVLEQGIAEMERRRWVYTFFTGCDDIRRRLEKLFRIHMHRIPMEEDPFSLHRCHFEAFQNMLQEAKKCL